MLYSTPGLNELNWYLIYLDHAKARWIIMRAGAREAFFPTAHRDLRVSVRVTWRTGIIQMIYNFVKRISKPAWTQIHLNGILRGVFLMLLFVVLYTYLKIHIGCLVQQAIGEKGIKFEAVISYKDYRIPKCCTWLHAQWMSNPLCRWDVFVVPDQRLRANGRS